MNFGSLIQAFQGFFSRAFWFSRFLPVALIAAGHAALARYLLGWRLFEGDLATSLAEEAGAATLAFVALAVLAYALGPTIPLIGAVLDGSALPGWLHNRLRDDRRAEWNEPWAAYREALERYDAVKKARDSSGTVLVQAVGAGSALAAITDAAAIERAERAVGALAQGTAPSGSAIDAAAEPLAAALRLNSAQLPGDAQSDALDTAHSHFHQMVAGALREAQHQVEAAQARLGARDEDDVQPTRFGDARSLLRRYARDTYGAPLDYLWPRVRMAIVSGEDDDGKGTPRLVADSTAQVDFAVFLFALWWTIPLVWLPAIVVEHKSIWALLALGLAAPLVGKALYELAIRAEIVSGSAVSTALDAYRRDALKLLGFTPPTTLSAERQLWSKLEGSRDPGRAVELIYSKQGGDLG